jgi:hypothetical protein
MGQRLVPHSGYRQIQAKIFSYIKTRGKILPCIIDLSYLKKLFEILKEINNDAVHIHLGNIDGRYKALNDDSKREEYEKLKKDIMDEYKIHVQITGPKGEYLASDSSSIFNEERLPDSLSSVKFDNSFFYKIRFNMNPELLINVDLDFSKPPLLDFITNPSYPTANNSIIQVFGENETWVEGSHEKILSSLKERRSKRAWLHQKNVYDLFLWFFILPISFWNLRKIDVMISPMLDKYSTILKVAVYVYIFIVILNLFRFAFNWLRWIFPYLELKTSLKKGYILHRVVLVGVVLSMIYSLTKDLCLWIIKHLFY